uniref:Uncharacterized protein n=1 Tax=Setaria viridis TaxID=4556 RepID=A0A4U6U4R8_SETVI|nr:hypothetical protein SEVIR_6G177550v2 [Setaria viridis]
MARRKRRPQMMRDGSSGARAGGSCFPRPRSTGARGNDCKASSRLVLVEMPLVAVGFLFASNPSTKMAFRLQN